MGTDEAPLRSKGTGGDHAESERACGEIREEVLPEDGEEGGAEPVAAAGWPETETSTIEEQAEDDRKWWRDAVVHFLPVGDDPNSCGMEHGVLHKICVDP